MLDELWLFVIGATAVWAIWAGHSLLTLAIALALLVSASLLVWRRFSLAGVGYTRRLERDRVTFNETIELTIELVNLKPLPLTWLQIEDMVPRRLTIDGGTVRQGPSDFFRFLTIVVAMLPYERIVRHSRCDASAAASASSVLRLWNPAIISGRSQNTEALAIRTA
jgi:uncharacterized repeat protein (TIGR01451 family)